MSVTRPETGLPKLPVGQWWRVAKVHGNSLYCSDARYIITNPREWEPTHYEVQIVQRQLVSVAKTISRSWWKGGDYTQHTSEWQDVVQHRRSIVKNVPADAPFHAGYLEYHDVITPELVLEAAEGLLQQIESEAKARRERQEREREKREAQQKSESLLGDYPPKILPAVGG